MNTANKTQPFSTSWWLNKSMEAYKRSIGVLLEEGSAEEFMRFGKIQEYCMVRAGLSAFSEGYREGYTDALDAAGAVVVNKIKKRLKEL